MKGKSLTDYHITFQKCCFFFLNDNFTAHEADAKMAVEYRASTVTNMDFDDSKIGYKQFFLDGSKLKYSGNEIKTSFKIGLGDVIILKQ